MNCDMCKEGFYKLNGTNNCYNRTMLNDSFYFDGNYFYPCDKNCLTCSQGKNGTSNNCLSCDNNKGLYLVESLSEVIIDQSCSECKEGYNFKYQPNNCYNNETIEQNYYLDKESQPYKYKPCYFKCGSCNKFGNITHMNCLSCNKNIINNQTSKPYNYKLTENSNCIEGCEDNYFLTLSDDCVLTCPNDTYEFYPNRTCLEDCPQNYEKNKNEKKCVKKTIEQTSSSEFKTQIKNNITAFLNLNSSEVINGSDFIALILTSDDVDPKEQLKKGISAIDLGNCTEVLKEYYNIPKEESLIILNMESKNNETKKNEENNNNEDNSFNLGKNVQVEVYDKSGNKLDLSVCKQDIKIMKYIGNVEELDIQSAKDLANQGIDVFNASDDFFNDICQDYNNTNGKDIVIQDRRNDIYQNASFCQKGCSYDGMNYELMTANCICDSSILQSSSDNGINSDNTNNEEETLNFKSLTKSFISNLFDFNFEVFRCYNLVLNIKKLTSNIGFYCMCTTFGLQSIFLFVFLIKRLTPLKYFMLLFKNNKPVLPPRKRNRYSIRNVLDNSSDNKNKISLFSHLKMIDEYDNEDINNNNIQNGKDKIIFANNIAPTINIQNQILNINNQNNNKKGKIKEIKLGNEINKNKLYSIKPNKNNNFKKNKEIKKIIKNIIMILLNYHKVMMIYKIWIMKMQLFMIKDHFLECIGLF